MNHELHTFVTILFPPTHMVRLTHVIVEKASIQLQLTATAPTAACPLGGVPSASIHSRYRRRLTDLPWGTRVVRIHLMVRKGAGGPHAPHPCAAGHRGRRGGGAAGSSLWHHPRRSGEASCRGPAAGPLSRQCRRLVGPASDGLRGLSRSEPPVCRWPPPGSPYRAAGRRSLPSGGQPP
jgi:hypothetical protein